MAWSRRGEALTHPGRARRRPEIATVAALSAAALILLGVLTLAAKVAEGDTAVLDRGLLVWIRVHLGGLPGLRAAMLDATALGDMPTLGLVALGVAGWLALGGRRASALFLLAQAAAGSALVHAAKPWFGRARPDVVARWAPFAGDSFPSGHSADSAIVYLSVAVIAARAAPTRRHRIFLIAMAATASILVGVSRMFLGVHWPTDVIAGWAVGAVWAVLCGLIAGRLEAPRPAPT